MEKNLYLKIDDDVARAANKISKERATDITLIFPKESWLLADVINLKLLKKQTDALGKRISILTNDKQGQEFAKQVGFGLKSMDVLSRGRASMDAMARKPRQQTPLQELYPKKEATGDDWHRKPAHSIYTPPVAPTAPVMPAYQPIPEPEPVQEYYEEPEEETYQVEEQPEQQYFEPEPQQYRSTPVYEQYQSAPVAPRPEPKLITRRPVEQTYEEAPRKVSYKKGIIFLIVSILIAAVVLATVILPKADILVYAHAQPISREMQISIDSAVKQPDTTNLTLPAKKVSGEYSMNQQFNATGTQNIGVTARGNVQIVNFTGRTLRLNAGTTVLSVGNKNFKLQNDVTGITATKRFANGDIDPASLTPEVAVIAEAPGDDYNFPAGTRVEIKNDVLGSVPQQLYAQNTKAIEGGVSRYTNLVTQEDITKAETRLREAVVSSAQQQAMKQSGLTLLPSGAKVEVTNISFDRKAGDAALNFTGTVTAKVEGVAYDFELLSKMVRERIIMTLDAGKSLASDAENSYKIEFKSYDLATGAGVLAVNYEGQAISALDSKEIESKVRGKNPSEVKEILLSNPNIDGVDLTLSPFWVNSVPDLFGRVYVKVDGK